MKKQLSQLFPEKRDKLRLYRLLKTATAGCYCLLVLVSAAACSDDDDTPAVQPSLSVAPESISATAAADSYPIAVTANVAWTAAVSSGATWCTLTGGNATGNGTVTVNVAENPTVGEQRAATVTVSAGTLTQQVTVTQAGVSFYAASTQTWTFGAQTWSDAIHISACNKPDFTISDTDPQCRSYTEGTSTWYYYNWAYVDANAAALCPSPWRVPSREDFGTLVSNANIYSTFISDWGYGGYANSSGMGNVSTGAYYWSSTEYSSSNALSLFYASGASGLFPGYSVVKPVGFQVRCVK